MPKLTIYNGCAVCIRLPVSCCENVHRPYWFKNF